MARGARARETARAVVSARRVKRRSSRAALALCLTVTDATATKRRRPAAQRDERAPRTRRGCEGNIPGYGNFSSYGAAMVKATGKTFSNTR